MSTQTNGHYLPYDTPIMDHMLERTTLKTLHSENAHCNLNEVSLPGAVHDGVESVRDGDDCAVCKLGAYRCLDQIVRFQVHSGRSFVQD